MKKNTILLLSGCIALLNACSSTYYAGTSVPDDVYYSSRDVQPVQQPAPAAPSADQYTPAEPQQEPAQPYVEENTYPAESYSTTDTQGNTVVNNNYYIADDYYDYSYTSRIRRFDNPIAGYGYYDPYYTNSYYYDYNPVNWGVSIYAGYNWWAPSYMYYSPFYYSGFSIGIGFGWGYPYYGYSPYFYNPWYSWCAPPMPYYGYGWGAGWGYGWGAGWGYGYGCGFYGGYYGACNPYYYNSFDGNLYYGPRGSSPSGNSPRPSSEFGFGRNTTSIGDKYTDAIAQGKISRPTGEINSVPGEMNTGTGLRPSTGDQKINSDVKTNTGTRPGSNAASSPDVNSGTGLRPDTKAGDRSNTTAPAVKSPVGGTSGAESASPRNEVQPVTPGSTRVPSSTGSSDVNNPSKGIISNKNQAGQTPQTVPATGRGNDESINGSGGKALPSSPSAKPSTSPSRGNTTPPSNGIQQQPSRGSDYSRPKGSFEQTPAPPSNREYKSPGASPRESITPRNVQPGNRSGETVQPGRNGIQQKSPQQRDTKFNRWMNEISKPSGGSGERNPNIKAPSQRDAKPSMEMPRSRDQQRSPTFQPRNEPKQFRQPSNPTPSMPQRSTPSAPSRGNSGGGNRGR